MLQVSLWLSYHGAQARLSAQSYHNVGFVENRLLLRARYLLPNYGYSVESA